MGLQKLFKLSNLLFQRIFLITILTSLIFFLINSLIFYKSIFKILKSESDLVFLLLVISFFILIFLTLWFYGKTNYKKIILLSMLIVGLIIRIFIGLQVNNPENNIIQSSIIDDSFFNLINNGILKSFIESFFVSNLSKYMAVFVLESILFILLILILRKWKINYILLILYFLNPLIISEFYSSFNINLVLFILFFALILKFYYSSNFLLCSIIFGFGFFINFYFIVFIPLFIKKLRFYIVIPIVMLIVQMLVFQNFEYFSRKILDFGYIKKALSYVFNNGISLNSSWELHIDFFQFSFVIALILTINLFFIIRNFKLSDIIFYTLLLYLLIFPKSIKPIPQLLIILIVIFSKNLIVILPIIFLYIFQNISYEFDWIIIDGLIILSIIFYFLFKDKINNFFSVYTSFKESRL